MTSYFVMSQFETQ